MSWDKGFNFRQTSGAAADGLNETYVLSDLYPTTRNGVTFGWNQSIGKINRPSGTDRRLAGSNYNYSLGNPVTFRIDLPAPGQYQLWAAFGDPVYPNYSDWAVLDGATSRKVWGAGAITAGNMRDAAGTDYSWANWLTSNSPIAVTFTSQLFYLTQIAQRTSNVVCHLFLSQVATAKPWLWGCSHPVIGGGVI